MDLEISLFRPPGSRILPSRPWLVQKFLLSEPPFSARRFRPASKGGAPCSSAAPRSTRFFRAPSFRPNLREIRAIFRSCVGGAGRRAGRPELPFEVLGRQLASLPPHRTTADRPTPAREWRSAPERGHALRLRAGALPFPSFHASEARRGRAHRRWGFPAIGAVL